jgi:hypothetical protein
MEANMAQSIDHFITYSVISSSPALSYTSVVSTIRVFPVTSGQHEGHTYITWTGNFSSDADAGKLSTRCVENVRYGADLGVIAHQHFFG